jgi:rare lipoprotein A
MRSFLAATVAALALTGGTALPASAFGGASLRDTGAVNPSAQVHLARAVAGEEGGVKPVDRWQREGRLDRSRYGKPRLARSARSAVRQGRVARRSGHRTARNAARSGRAAAMQPAAAGSGITGMASYYWQGSRTATGERYNPEGMTAAHRSLPFGTRVRVTHLGSGRSVDVRINDRGPFIGGRIIDLSRGAAGVIGMHSQGVARVKVTVLGR